MPLVEWDDAFSVGINKIDEQHKRFFSLINMLYDAVQEGKGDELIDSVLKGLQQYMIYHFKTEESWMKMHNYPDLNSHKQEHQEAIQKVNKFILEYERGQRTVTIELMKFLSDWLQNHILQSDRKYIPYLQDKV